MTVERDEFRRALQRFASGVTVVTVGGDEPHGMTASSFASVSLDPPLVLVCLDKSSKTRGLILQRGSFAVNVLSVEQEEVSRSFSRRGTKPFAHLPHHYGVSEHPLLDDAIAWIECNVHNVIESGDHDIVIGEVVACDAQEGDPLLYVDQGYRGLSHS